jgi:hypothetical protein
MNRDAAQTSRPLVNLKGLHEQVLLSTNLMRLDSQLRNFTPLRDRLVSFGRDANAAYRQIESRRDQVMAELKKLTPAPVTPQPPIRPVRPGPVLSLPIAAPRFLPPGNTPWFGFGGSVKMGSANEGDEIIPPGTTGSVDTLSLEDDGIILFSGQLAGVPLADQPPEPLPTILPTESYWLHSWVYLIPFPPPVVASILTYDFWASTQVWTEIASGNVNFWSFVSVGETPDYFGQNVVANKVDSFPLVHDLQGPNYQYLGQSNVKRSFVVEGGHLSSERHPLPGIPAVAVVLGVVFALESGAEVRFGLTDSSTSALIPVDQSHSSVGVVNFHYDPIAVTI